MLSCISKLTLQFLRFDTKPVHEDDFTKNSIKRDRFLISAVGKQFLRLWSSKENSYMVIVRYQSSFKVRTTNILSYVLIETSIKAS